MPLAIQFIKGSLDGRRYAVGGTPLAVGRSHSCGIRPSEPDVSGRHLEIMAAGEVLAVQVLSGHRTAIGGRPAPHGETAAVSPGTVVELGSKLAFRVIDADSGGSDTTSISPRTDPGTEGSAETAAGTVPTSWGAASAPAVPCADTTSPGGPEIRDEGETGMFSGPPPSTASAATMAPATGTAILPDGAGTGTAPAFTYGTTGGDSESGETQVLNTQSVSREELEELKKTYVARKARKAVSRFTFLGIAAAAALGVSFWASTREPEKFLAMPPEKATVQLLPALDPGPGKTAGSIGLLYPSAGSSVVRKDNAFGGKSLEIATRIGRKLDVELVLAADVFRDPSALNESRADTFRRYLENSPDLVSALDNRVSLSGEDFFGGGGGLRRAVPCSRMGYWRMRGEQSVFGVVSFFRNGELCCALRREVPATEQLRAERMLHDARVWLFTDPSGAFSASQWEGARGAGCADPALALSRCQSAFDLDTPSEWPGIETGLRDVLVETASGGGSPEIESRALSLLKDLRARKALHWKALVAPRVRLASTAGNRNDEAEARAIDRAVREAYPSPDEEWHFLARRARWWER